MKVSVNDLVDFIEKRRNAWEIVKEESKTIGFTDSIGRANVAIGELNRFSDAILRLSTKELDDDRST